MLLKFKGDVAYITPDTIVAADDDSSQSSNEVFMAKMWLTWFCQYPGSPVQGLITMQNSAYLD